MPLEDLSDPSRFQRKIKKDVKRAPVRSGGGDSSHPGSGASSLQLGPSANASGDNSTALGDGAFAGGVESTAVGTNSYATGEDSTALGSFATTEHDNSVALGKSAGTTAAWQVMLGTSFHTVVVPGTFSNPSARRLKQNITPAPEIDGLFPELHEYEYKANPGTRRIGYIADDMVGTGAERFVHFNDAGDVEGVAYLDMHTAQIAALLARIERLEDELRNRNG